MTTPDYPLLAVPGYELYQLAHVATFIAEGLARYRRAGDRAARRAAARDVQAGRVALARASGVPDAAAGPLPRPLDAGTYRAVQDVLAGAGERQVQIVSLAGLGRDSWAVVGFVPGLGPVGAEVADGRLAAALREHLLTQPAAELAGWCVTDRPVQLGVDRWGSADEAAAVAALNPDRPQHRIVADHLRDVSPECAAAAARTFGDTGSRTGATASADRGRAPAARLTEAGRRTFGVASRAIGPAAIEDEDKLANRAGPATARAATPVTSAAGRPASPHAVTTTASAVPITMAGP